jgi:uncharacterized surface protein with fasciclin (FAS1) repeats
MNIGKRLVILALGLAVLPQFAAAQSMDLVDKALATQKFNTFLSLLTDAGLTFTLKGPGPYTIFAPTDAAFNAKYTKAQLDSLRANPARLQLILMHHVVSGRLDAVSAVKMKSIHPMQGPAIPTGIIGGHGTIGGAHYVVTNVSATNGILHGIDQVLAP